MFLSSDSFPRIRCVSAWPACLFILDYLSKDVCMTNYLERWSLLLERRAGLHTAQDNRYNIP